MQGQGVLRFKGGAIRKACTTLIREDGRRTVWEGEWKEGENERPDDGGRIASAYVTENGVLRLYTDEEAKKIFEMEIRRRPTEKPAGEIQKEKKETIRAQIRKTEVSERTWPDRRWPPPPCMPKAHYVSGRWLG